LRALIFPILLTTIVIGAAALVCVPAAPPPNVLFQQVRAGDHAAVASALRADPKAIGWRDSLGYTPLHWAAAMHDEAGVALLLDAGADPNASDVRGRTPLHVAAMSQVRCGDVLMKSLIARGAAVDAADARGVTPLQVAQSVGRDDLARTLLAAGAAAVANGTDSLGVSGTPVADGARPSPQPAVASSLPGQSRPPRLHPFAARRAWARVHGLRPPRPVLRREG
jgi:hypothetical protein